MGSGLPPSSLFSGIADIAPAERVTFASLFARLERDSLAIAVLFLGIAGIAPGISVVAGVLLCLCAVQLLLGGKSLFLPRFLSERSLSGARVMRILDDAERVLARVSRQRRGDRPLPEYVKRAVGVPILILSLTLFVPIPLSNVVPAVIIVAIALACLADDGLLLCGALLGSFVSLALTAATIGAVIGVGHALL